MNYCPIGSVWLVGTSSAGVGGRPIYLFVEEDGEWIEKRSAEEGEILIIVGEDEEDEGWMRVLSSKGDVGYIWRGRLFSARRLDEAG